MRNALATALCLVALGAISAGTYVAAARASERAHADAAPPASMSPLDAARLHAATAEVGRLAAQVQQLEAQAAPYRRAATEILARYAVDPRDYGKTVTVDYETGRIERAPLVPPKTPQQDSPKAKAVTK